LEKTINFLKYKYIALAASWIFIITLTAGTIFTGGFNYGIDFVGGYKIIAKFQDSSVNEGSIRKALSDFNPTVQKIGEESKNQFIITTKLEDTAAAAVKGSSDQTSYTKYDLLKKTLSEKFAGVSIASEETVGPAIGEYLRKSAWKLTLMAVVMMSIYLAFRFEVKYAVGGMVCLFHDMAMSIAFCGIMGIEINIQVLAALLTLYGYSINDTIVIFDRIRETDQLRAKTTFDDVINKAITQTLTRTLLTGVTTLFAVLVLFLIGGEALHDFSFVLLFGIIIGTYSSIYIASPAVLWWEKWRAAK
jgi:preprotein translocase subunit SecF